MGPALTPQGKPPSLPPLPPEIHTIITEHGPALICSFEKMAAELFVEHGGDTAAATVTLAGWLMRDVSPEMLSVVVAMVAMAGAERAAGS